MDNSNNETAEGPDESEEKKEERLFPKHPQSIKDLGADPIFDPDVEPGKGYKGRATFKCPTRPKTISH